MTDTDRPLTEATQDGPNTVHPREHTPFTTWTKMPLPDFEGTIWHFLLPADLVESIEEAAVERAKPEIEKAAREGCDKPHTADWAVEMRAERDARIAAEAVAKYVEALERVKHLARPENDGTFDRAGAARIRAIHDTASAALLTQADKPAAVTPEPAEHEHRWGYFTGIHGQQTTTEHCFDCRMNRSDFEAAVTERRENE